MSKLWQKIWTVIFIFLLILPFIVAQFTSGAGPVVPVIKGNVEELIILSAHRGEVQKEYSRGFSLWLAENYQRQAELKWQDVGGGGQAIVKALTTAYEKTPDNPGVDILFGGGLPIFYHAKNSGWLTTVNLPAETLAGIPATCIGIPVYDPDTPPKWFGVALSGFGIVYNKTVLERLHLPAPETWADLASPEFFSWVSCGDPTKSGSLHVCFEIILQAYGWDEGWGILTRLVGNTRRLGENAGIVPREVAAGDVAAGMVIDQYAQTTVAAVGDSRAVFVLPQGATPINADPIGKLRGAQNSDLADLFIQFVLSPDGQRLLYQPAGVHGQRYALYRQPVLASAYRNPNEYYSPQTSPYDLKTAFNYDTTKETKRRDILNDLISAYLIDSHAALVRAWEKVIERGCQPEDMKLLASPPLSENEVLDLADAAGGWSSKENSRNRSEIRLKWSNAAVERYKSLL